MSTSSPIWHPFTQHALTPHMQRIVKTEGAYLYDDLGNRILDMISSWWVITLGHRHPVIMKAIQNACEQWDQIIFAEYSHEPAENLAKALISLTPKLLQHVFYSDSGSTAVEVAVKMALSFFKNQGVPRTRIVAMAHGYHGDTIGAMSAGEQGVFNAAYEPLLFQVDRLPFPKPKAEQQTLDAFENFCKSKQVAALLIEPLLLGAGGFKMYSPFVLTQLKRIAERYDCLFIADEVMTGWGRTGRLFACDHANITPDILCTSKGLTGGSLPLAATLCTEEIFQAHVSTDRRKTFFHSSSYTANAIACSAAIANIEVWHNEPVYDRIQALAKKQQMYLAAFADDARFSSIRQLGTITALEVNTDNQGYLSTLGPSLKQIFRKKNVLLRPLGNVIYVMPPYCVSAQDLEMTYQAINEAVDRVLQR